MEQTIDLISLLWFTIFSICCDIYVIPHIWVLYYQILSYADKVISIDIDIFKIFLLYKVYKKYNN